MNLASLVENHPAEGRALYEDGVWSNWGELRRKAACCAASLRRMGVVPGERVALCLPTSVDFVVAYLAVLCTGGVAVPLNPGSPAAELASELGCVEPKLVLTRGPSTGSVEAAGFNPTETGVLMGKDDEGTFTVEPRADEDLAVLLFTSGTAGSPKAAMLTHGNLVSNLRQMQSVPGEIFSADDTGIAAVPLFHVFGLNVALGLALATGGSLVLQARFHPVESLRLVDELGVSTLLGVPAMFAAWSESGAGANLGNVRLALSGAAALAPEIAGRFEECFGIRLDQGYGLTEASPAVATTVGTSGATPGSVGPPIPGVELRLVEEIGEDVLLGDPGEIWVRGPNVFQGYFGDPESTRTVIDSEGWLHTGDVGILDDSGRLYVVDRKKDLVIVSGFNVFPAEVEHVLNALQGVSESVVVGRPDESTGEAVEAYVVRAPGSSLTEGSVREHCVSRLARYKCPTSVRFVDELPHGLVGKALRRALREQS